ncbi:MAG: right-handed parallel beta-helix repeat-containing protein, partial [Candidatus Thorarchaeota archaeon]
MASGLLYVQQIQPVTTNISVIQIEGLESQNNFIPSYDLHDPIVISSNDNFSTLGFPGSGTPELPYIIAGYNITTSGDCISIKDTDAHFVIRDCLLTGGKYNQGIELDDVNNGIVRNNTLLGKAYGMYISFISDITIENNTFSGNSDFGVYINTAQRTSIINNNISGSVYGVTIGSSWDCTLASNTFENNGIRITGNLNQWRHNITTDNTVNGKSLGYFWNLTSGVIDGNQYGQVILANCTGVTVEDGTFNNATVGILMGYSSFCNLNNNTFSGDSQSGIYLRDSSDNIMKNNNISGT